MDARVALRRMDQLLAPGGTLAIVGLARSRLPADLLWEAAAVAANLRYRLTRTYWQQPSPTVWPPPHTYTEIQALARRALPGVCYRRHLLWRYSLVWVKPVPLTPPDPDEGAANGAAKSPDTGGLWRTVLYRAIRSPASMLGDAANL